MKSKSKLDKLTVKILMKRVEKKNSRGESECKVVRFLCVLHW